jgi:hypothetical protein
MSRNFGFGMNLGLFSMILNNKGQTWKSQGLFFHVLGCNINIDGKFSGYKGNTWKIFHLSTLFGRQMKITIDK